MKPERDSHAKDGNQVLGLPPGVHLHHHHQRVRHRHRCAAAHDEKGVDEDALRGVRLGVMKSAAV